MSSGPDELTPALDEAVSVADIELGVEEAGARRANLLSIASRIGDGSGLPAVVKLVIDVG